MREYDNISHFNHFCSCGKGVLHGWFQMEVFGEGIKEKIGFSTVKIEEGQFGFIVAQHGLDIFVVEVVVGTIHQIRIVDSNGNGHS